MKGKPYQFLFKTRIWYVNKIVHMFGWVGEYMYYIDVFVGLNGKGNALNKWLSIMSQRYSLLLICLHVCLGVTAFVRLNLWKAITDFIVC